MLSPGTVVCWRSARQHTSLRGSIVAVVKAGTAPAQAAPELIGLKTTQVKFSDLSRPRASAHYVVRREERTDRGTDQCCYYLPLVQIVKSVREEAPRCP